MLVARQSRFHGISGQGHARSTQGRFSVQRAQADHERGGHAAVGVFGE